MFSVGFGQTDIDPRWLHVGVMRFPPTPERRSWLNVSSGLSTDWEARGESGFGLEFVLETEEASDWGIRTLQWLTAYQILLAHGRYGERRFLTEGQRVNGAGPTVLEGPNDLAGFLAGEPDHYPRTVEVGTGPFDLIAWIGITPSEMAQVKVGGSEGLWQALRSSGVYPVTSLHRESVV
jgi:suppressor of fused protein SUFU